MEPTLLLAIVFILILLGLFMLFRKRDEKFGIPFRTSSGWDWNVGTGYMAGDTGYSKYGIWPGNLPLQPWTWWQWRRRPLIFKTPFTPVPQIDYNNAGYNSKPLSNYNISLLPQNGRIRVAVNGLAGRTLQLDRLRNYYFHIYSPGAPIMFTTDGITPYAFEPISEGNVQVNFDESSPDILYYGIVGSPDSGGVIYLNTI